MKELDRTFEWLVDHCYFTEEELILITHMNGYNMETFNLACRCRYALDVEQLKEEEENNG